MPAPIPLEVFFSYAQEDELLKRELEKHLAVLLREKILRGWSSRRVDAGASFRGEVDLHLDRADVILFLVSADFLASDYLYDSEMRRAISRHEAKETLVVAILLRPCDYREAPFMLLEDPPVVLPLRGPGDPVPITLWQNRDEAFEKVVDGLRRLKNLRISPRNPPVAHPPIAPGR